MEAGWAQVHLYSRVVGGELRVGLAARQRAHAMAARNHQACLVKYSRLVEVEMEDLKHLTLMRGPRSVITAV